MAIPRVVILGQGVGVRMETKFIIAWMAMLIGFMCGFITRESLKKTSLGGLGGSGGGGSTAGVVVRMGGSGGGGGGACSALLGVTNDEK